MTDSVNAQPIVTKYAKYAKYAMDVSKLTPRQVIGEVREMIDALGKTMVEYNTKGEADRFKCKPQTDLIASLLSEAFPRPVPLIGRLKELKMGDLAEKLQELNKVVQKPREDALESFKKIANLCTPLSPSVSDFVDFVSETRPLLCSLKILLKKIEEDGKSLDRGNPLFHQAENRFITSFQFKKERQLRFLKNLNEVRRHYCVHEKKLSA